MVGGGGWRGERRRSRRKVVARHHCIIIAIPQAVHTNGAVPASTYENPDISDHAVKLAHRNLYLRISKASTTKRLSIRRHRPADDLPRVQFFDRCQVQPSFLSRHVRVITATQVRLGAAGAKSRFTTFSSIGRRWFESVVETRNLFAVLARIPACFISRATVSRSHFVHWVSFTTVGRGMIRHMKTSLIRARLES